MYRYILCIILAMVIAGSVSIVQAEEYLTPLEQIIRKSQRKATTKIIRRISYVIKTESVKQAFNPYLIAAVIWTESRFKHTATGADGEIGLMQIMYNVWKPSTILKYNKVDSKRKLYWIGLNVRCGTQILKHHLRYADGDIVMALYRYNSGRKRLPKGTQRHSVAYANKVLTKFYEITEYVRQVEGG